MTIDKITGIVIIALNIAGLCFIGALLISNVIKKNIGPHSRNKKHSPESKSQDKGNLGHGNINASEDDDIFEDMDLMDFDDLDLDDFD